MKTHKTSGDHDGRYYTESEVDKKLNLKANAATPTFTGIIKHGVFGSTNQQLMNVNSGGIVYFGNPATCADLYFETTKTGTVNLRTISVKRIALYTSASLTVNANSVNNSLVLPTEYQGASFYATEVLNYAGQIFSSVESSHYLYLRNVDSTAHATPVRVLCIWLW